MSLAAMLAIASLAGLMLASLCYTFRVRRAHDALRRLNWFRTFAHWTMFAAHPDPSIRPGAFVIEYRDTPQGPWCVAIDGHHWRPHSFLLSPQRFIAARAHHLGQIFAAIRREKLESEMQAELRDRENTIANYLLRVHPLPAGQIRAVRVVKRFGTTEPDEEEVAWEFTVRGHE